MAALDVARWQFAITTIYHFLLVPLTIGLSVFVAVLETAWVRTGKTAYLRATKFWGKLLLINIALGVATGLVQEFQFGMAWSEYSRFAGDVLGAPLAIEGLLAFFLESTFIGLWIFGWDRLPKALHAGCMWAVALGSQLSAYVILAANSWMQHPVGWRYNPATDRAELTDFAALLTNSTLLAAYPHTIAASFITAGALMIGVCGWHLAHTSAVDVFRPSLRLALWVTALAAVALAVTGDAQSRLMTAQQPMKMAAAEALYETTAPAGFSLFTVGTPDGSRELVSLRVPRLLSFLATGTFDGTVEGIDDLQRAAEEQFGPGDYTPYVPVAYWSFRLMIGLGMAAGAIAALGLWLTRAGRTPRGRWYWRLAVAGIALPMLANSFGWLFTEMGRQPWSVYGVSLTADGVSPSVPAGTLIASLTLFTCLYAALGYIEVRLLTRHAKAGPMSEAQATAPAFTY